jgi:hypothetical protein
MMERMHEHTHQEHAPAVPQMNQLKDPVCGMAVRGDSSHRVTHGGISPIIAAAAMSASSVSVVGNALRLRTVDV